MIKGIRHTGIVVADLDSAVSFWCDVLGFTVSRRMDESGECIDAALGLDDVKVTTVKLAAPDGNLVELLRFHSHPAESAWRGKVNTTGLTHIALTSDNLDQDCARLRNAGVHFDSPPQYSPDGYAKITFGRGPEGILLELVEIVGNLPVVPGQNP